MFSLLICVQQHIRSKQHRVTMLNANNGALLLESFLGHSPLGLPPSPAKFLSLQDIWNYSIGHEHRLITAGLTHCS